jgi:hypothetical protein
LERRVRGRGVVRYAGAALVARLLQRCPWVRTQAARAASDTDEAEAGAKLPDRGAARRRDGRARCRPLPLALHTGLCGLRRCVVVVLMVAHARAQTSTSPSPPPSPPPTPPNSPPASPPPPSPPPCRPFDTGYNYPGADLAGSPFVSATVDSCAHACELLDGAVYFTFRAVHGLPVWDRLWAGRSGAGVYISSDIVVATRLVKRPLGRPSTLMAGGAHDAPACTVRSFNRSSENAPGAGAASATIRSRIDLCTWSMPSLCSEEHLECGR